MVAKPPDSAPFSLVSLLTELSGGGSVLWIGDARVSGLDVLAESGKVVVFDPGIRKKRRRASLDIRPCPSRFTDLTGFELVAVADIATVAGDMVGRLEELQKAANLALVVRWLPENKSDVQAVLERRFSHVRIFGESQFRGAMLADEDGEGVLLDDSLVPRVESEAWVAVCSKRKLDLDACLITRHPVPVEAREEAREDEEIRRLEARLAERARRVSELEDELKHQEALVRDMVEHLNRLAEVTVTSGEPDGATLRRLQDENASLTLQIARVQERCAQLEASTGAKDALVTRLQLELAEVENHGSESDHRIARLIEENEQLRETLLEAAEDNAKPPPRLVEGWLQGRRAMERVRALLSDLLAGDPEEALSQTAVGIEPPDSDTPAFKRD